MASLYTRVSTSELWIAFAALVPVTGWMHIIIYITVKTQMSFDKGTCHVSCRPYLVVMKSLWVLLRHMNLQPFLSVIKLHGCLRNYTIVPGNVFRKHSLAIHSCVHDARIIISIQLHTCLRNCTIALGNVLRNVCKYTCYSLVCSWMASIVLPFSSWTQLNSRYVWELCEEHFRVQWYNFINIHATQY